jgi:hypothetical protein
MPMAVFLVAFDNRSLVAPGGMKMTIKWEKVHIFISSTFNDMHAERDYLVKRNGTGSGVQYAIHVRKASPVFCQLLSQALH